MSRKILALSLLPFLLVGCLSASYQVNPLTENVFEVTYVSAEGESYSTTEDKWSLYAAYEARKRGCRYFATVNDAGDASRTYRRTGIWSRRVEHRDVVKCYQADPAKSYDVPVSGVYETELTIKLMESRYGAISNIKSDKALPLPKEQQEIKSPQNATNIQNVSLLDIQRKLKELGYYSGRVDGIFGDGTQAALVQFQSLNGLKPDGIVGRGTIDVLFK